MARRFATGRRKKEPPPPPKASTKALAKLPPTLEQFMPSFQAAFKDHALLVTWDDSKRFVQAEQPAAIGRVLVKSLHVHLREAEIGYLFRKEIKHRGKHVWAQASKVGGKLGHYSEKNLLIEVNWMTWLVLEPARRIALIDHELSHFGREETSKGDTKYTLIPHDLEEFDAIARRWGSWRPEVAHFANAHAEGAQLSLFTSRLMQTRPAIGQRVRVLGNARLKHAADKRGEVIHHYPDGIAFRVRLDADAKEVVCDPVNVEPEKAHA
ncbi:MAG TPA: putative metallopeptidase [Gemmatimonadaceae bacterium]|jgi:hypothetical protein